MMHRPINIRFSNIQSLHWTRVYSLVDFPQDNGEYPQCRYSTHYARADTCLKPRCTNHLQHLVVFCVGCDDEDVCLQKRNISQRIYHSCVLFGTFYNQVSA